MLTVKTHINQTSLESSFIFKNVEFSWDQKRIKNLRGKSGMVGFQHYLKNNKQSYFCLN